MSHTRLLLSYLSGWRLLYLIGAVLFASKSFLRAFLSGQLYRIVFSLGDQADAWRVLLRQMGQLSLALLLVSVLTGAGEILMMRASGQLDYRLRKELFRRITRMPEARRQRQNTGYWTNLFGRELDTVQELPRDKWPQILGNVISIVGGLAILFTHNRPYALFALFCGVQFFILIALLKRPAKRLRDKEFQTLAQTSERLGEMALSLPLIRFYQLEQPFSEGYFESLETQKTWGRKSAQLSTLAMGLWNLGYGVTYVGSLIFGLHLVHQGTLPMADLMYLWSIVYNVAYAIQGLGFKLIEYQKHQAVMERVREGLELPVEISGTKHPHPPYTIEAHQLNFSYTTQKPVLQNLDLHIAPGEKIAIVGSSGSGKSSFFRLLLGLYRPDSGTLQVGGCATTDAALPSLRESFSYLAQEPYLMNGTLEENLRLVKPTASPEELTTALTRAGLAPLLHRLPQGLATPIGENGRMLSGGERQRLGLARCYLRNAPIFLMDEVSSALDPQLEEAVLQELFSLEEETVLCITHKFAAARLADRILLFQDGRIAEDGSHDELMAQQGLYFHLLKGEAHAKLPQETRG